MSFPIYLLFASNLTAAEDRVRELQAVLSALIPGVSLDSILTSYLQEPKASTVASSYHQTSSSSSKVSQDVLDPVAPGNAAGSGIESLPREAEGFDWAEHEFPSGGVADGMAALSINPAGAGYLGNLRFKSLNDFY